MMKTTGSTGNMPRLSTSSVTTSWRMLEVKARVWKLADAPESMLADRAKLQHRHSFSVEWLRPAQQRHVIGPMPYLTGWQAPRRFGQVVRQTGLEPVTPTITNDDGQLCW